MVTAPHDSRPERRSGATPTRFEVTSGLAAAKRAATPVRAAHPRSGFAVVGALSPDLLGLGRVGERSRFRQPDRSGPSS